MNKLLIPKKSFTLVELIVVIAIIAVLSVISVLVVSEWIGKSRDTRRLGDASQIEKGIDISKITNNTFPTPDNYVIGTAMSAAVVYKGTFGDGAVTKTNIKTAPKDPSTDGFYTYSVSSDGTYYQISYVMENGGKVTYLKDSTYAASTPVAGVRGNYRGVLPYSSGTNYYIANIPSIIFTSSTGADLLSTGTYFVVNNKENLPYTFGSITKSQVKDTDTLVKEVVGSSAALTAANITAFYTSNTPLVSLINGSLLTAFGGSSIVNTATSAVGGNVNAVVTPVAYISGNVYASGQQFLINGLTVTAYGNGSGYVAGTDGGIGCNTPDRIIWTGNSFQIWSACNIGTTVAGFSSGSYGNYYQRGRNDNVTSGTFINSTYNSTFTNGSTANTNFYAGDAVNYEWYQPEVGSSSPTRWTGTNPQGPCPSGRHVPSSGDWQTACNTILNTTCTSAIAIGNFQNTLLLPLNGERLWNDGSTIRQNSTAYYWTSSPDIAKARYLTFSSNIYISGGGYRALGSGVRCIKN